MFKEMQFIFHCEQYNTAQVSINCTTGLHKNIKRDLIYFSVHENIIGFILINNTKSERIFGDFLLRN